jgi:hypothetical protein
MLPCFLYSFKLADSNPLLNTLIKEKPRVILQ